MFSVRRRATYQPHFFSEQLLYSLLHATKLNFASATSHV